jgi:hypothetical protein
MASRYMNYLRKNTKYIMVAMTIVCMITFVVGSALIDMANNARRGASEENQNPVAVTWAKGKVHNEELRKLRYRHEMAYRFLFTVIQTALERGGRPIINGQPLTPQMAQQGFDVGIPQDNSEETAIQTMVLAEEGKRMGLVVDQQAVQDYLRQLSSPELKSGDWLDIAREVVGGSNSGISVSQLFEHLAYELRAQHVRMLTMSGLYAQGVGPIVPPGEAFEMFNRLNRKLSIEAYPVEVAAFVGEVKGEPSAAELQKLFDEGKFRDPNPNLDEPGFHKPHKLAFKYLKTSFTPFLDEAKKQITEEQIAEAYQKDIEQGLHKVQELPPETSPTEKKPEAEPTTEKPAETPASEPAKDTKETKEAPVTEKPADKPVEKAVEDAAKSNDKGGCEAVDQEPADKPAEGKPSEEKPADVKSAEQPATPAVTEKPAAPQTPDLTAPATAPPAATEPKEQKFKPLTEVRDTILNRLAQPIAEEARKKAVGEVTTAIEKYGKELRRYEAIKSARKNSDEKKPADLDLAPLAAKYNFPIGETPLVDRFDVGKYEIGQKVQQIDMQALQMYRQIRMLTFADLAFSQDEPLYSPSDARSSEPDVNFIYFRTAEEKPADVTLKDVRAQVIEFWKMRQAFELALAEAKKLAEKAKDSASLADVASDRTKVVTPPAFSWMTQGGFGMGQPEFSTVEGIELAGREFMQGVFALKPGEAGVAPNQPHSRVYVVRAISQEPDDARLQALFAESGANQQILMLAGGERQYTFMQSLRGIEDQYHVKWQRPPNDGRRM